MNIRLKFLLLLLIFVLGLSASMIGQDPSSEGSASAIRALEQRPEDVIRATSQIPKIRIGQRISGYTRS